MYQVTASKRGWVSESPKDAFVGCMIGSGARVANQENGGLNIIVSATEDTKSIADITLDISSERFHVRFPGQALQVLNWPKGVTAAQIDACSAKFSRRRSELVLSLPALETEVEKIPSPVKSAVLAASEMTSLEPKKQGQERLAAEFPIERKTPKSDANEISMAPADMMKAIINAAGRNSDGSAPDPELLQMSGIWILHSAATNGEVKRVQSLLMAKVDANAADESGVTVLEKACIGMSIPTVELLLKSKANPSGMPNSPSTPLHRAVCVGKRGRKLAQLLRSHGARPSVKDETGCTPLELANKLGFEPFPELL